MSRDDNVDEPVDLTWSIIYALGGLLLILGGIVLALLSGQLVALTTSVGGVLLAASGIRDFVRWRPD